VSLWPTEEQKFDRFAKKEIFTMHKQLMKQRRRNWGNIIVLGL